MNTLIINNKKIDFVQPEQILNMGGPWICKMLIENNIKLDNVLIDNIVTNDNKLYFIKYIEKSKWQRNNFFQLFRRHCKQCLYLIDITRKFFA